MMMMMMTLFLRGKKKAVRLNAGSTQLHFRQEEQEMSECEGVESSHRRVCFNNSEQLNRSHKY